MASLLFTTLNGTAAQCGIYIILLSQGLFNKSFVKLAFSLNKFQTVQINFTKFVLKVRVNFLLFPHCVLLHHICHF